ncbi:hypothetical protein THASP1DRAFT_30898 [Thamnocephalis sphaerospora]|uniref:Uncharacterized protein n=1 Tax=Thamnocephalis sphaerospora TaxID=78915 RepID=A0A4P9XPU0_9FUNG|nr:hypothetical protein THASP1DRAFT_30898 [Thamnocephalis sphaerospora]|eukprot:RKP07280.1 hypothetical protein THASP1DRAFT_30898 [Thamnocephalis sphaerospora]
MDYFLHRSSYYEHSGLAVQWPWLTDSAECTMLPPTPTVREIRFGAVEDLRHEKMAFIVDMESAVDAGCKTLAQIGLGVQQAGREFRQLGYPPLSLLIVTVITNLEAPFWGPYTSAYSATEPSVPEGLPAVDVMLLDQWASKDLQEFLHAKPFSVHFKAVQERGVWNNVYLSAGYTSYVWLLFITVLMALAYGLMRFARLITLQRMPRGLHLFIVISTFVLCILLLSHLIIARMTLAGRVIECIVFLFSNGLLDLIVWHWTLHLTAILSRLAISSLLGSAAIHLMLSLCSFSVNCYFISVQGSDDIHPVVAALASYALSLFPILSIFAFSCFGMWFGWCAYRVRRIPTVRVRFLRLSLLSLLAAAAFASSTVVNFLMDQTTKHHRMSTVHQTMVLSSTLLENTLEAHQSSEALYAPATRHLTQNTACFETSTMEDTLYHYPLRKHAAASVNVLRGNDG